MSKATEETPCLCGKWRPIDKVCRNPGCMRYNKLSRGMVERGVSPEAAGVVPALLAVQGAMVLESAHGPDTIILTLAAPPTRPLIPGGEVTAQIVAAGGRGAEWGRETLGLDPEVVKRG